MTRYSTLIIWVFTVYRYRPPSFSIAPWKSHFCSFLSFLHLFTKMVLPFQQQTIGSYNFHGVHKKVRAFQRCPTYFSEKFGMVPKNAPNSKFCFLPLDFFETLTKQILAVMSNVKSLCFIKLAIVRYVSVQSGVVINLRRCNFLCKFVQAPRWNIAKNDIFKVKKIFFSKMVVRFVIKAPNNIRIRDTQIL